MASIRAEQKCISEDGVTSEAMVQTFEVLPCHQWDPSFDGLSFIRLGAKEAMGLKLQFTNFYGVDGSR